MIGAHFGRAVWALGSAAAVQQSRAPAHPLPPDSLVVGSPLPGGVAEFVRFLLNTVPPWVQLGGLVLAVILAALIVWYLLRRWDRITQWLNSRTRPVRLALLAAAVVFLLGIAGFGAATWNYTQHSNDFCTGCHVMNPAYERMAGGETKHSKLSCHDCHQQSIFASARQVYVWLAERPQEIGEHAKLPNRVCERCHVTQDTATWQRIASTAGHRVHFESDSSVLRDLQCVKCHGVEVHRFQPVNRTCGQSGCHETSDTRIVLGKMAGQTVRHCTSCHAFTVEVPALATADSARGTLVPGQSQCLGCHEMRRMLADFNARRDPHGGKCGTCHNPHTQETPQAAAQTCAMAGCHGDWREEPFHSGTHRRVTERCITCHLPHSATVDASDCRGCHEDVRRRSRLRPPIPFDTTEALRRAHAPGPPPLLIAALIADAANGARVMFAGFDPSVRPSLATQRPAPLAPIPEGIRRRAGPARPAPAQPDTFSHARHARLACLVCHETGLGHGRLTFERPRGCMICHHQAPSQARCANCHETGEYSAPKGVTVTVTVPGHSPRARPVDFLHGLHESRSCLDCHTTPVTLAPPPGRASCRDCHEEHHLASGRCSFCHGAAQPKQAHTSLEAAHQRCDACHTSSTVERLTPNRAFCGTCHTTQTSSHFPSRQCTVCHFLAEPQTYRSRLVTRPRG